MTRVFTAMLGAALLFIPFFVIGASAYGAETIIDQYDLTFKPNAATIMTGDTVRFTDTGRITHNITIANPDGSVTDEGMGHYGQDIVVHFTKPGVYQVRCSIHPTMRATITVK
jgi:plastocyanin